VGTPKTALFSAKTAYFIRWRSDQPPKSSGVSPLVAISSHHYIPSA
jgi:hypothetical protein